MQKLNIKMIGLFTIGGIVLFVGIIFMFIGDRIFIANKNQIVMYFQESINGLSIGSPVSFRGVEIGKVSKIDLMADTKNMNFSIAVFATLNETQTFRVQDFRKIKDKDIFFDELIKRGLRARLSTQSYLTGQMMIEVEMLPNSQLVMHGGEHFKNAIEIPTVLSPMGEISKGLQDLPIAEMIQKFNLLMDSFNQKFPIVLNQAVRISENLNKFFDKNSNDIPITLNNLNKTLIDLGEASRSVKNLTDYLERHPEALLKGKKKER